MTRIRFMRKRTVASVGEHNSCINEPVHELLWSVDEMNEQGVGGCEPEPQFGAANSTAVVVEYVIGEAPVPSETVLRSSILLLGTSLLNGAPFEKAHISAHRATRRYRTEWEITNTGGEAMGNYGGSKVEEVKKQVLDLRVQTA